MADMKTHLRELSVAVTVGLLNTGTRFSLSDLYHGKTFLSYARQVISNDISAADNLACYDVFPGEFQQIIDNGYKLGRKIHAAFHFPPNARILWLGNDTRKGDPIDISIGGCGFSLKEESFILKNMGLYQLLNTLTGSRYPRGLHIFKTFAPEEYDAWFAYTWDAFASYLLKYGRWELSKGENISRAQIYANGSRILLSFNGNVSEIPIGIRTTDQYMRYTSPQTREKVFSKWINEVLSDDSRYLALKRNCAVTAGERISAKINREFRPDHVYDFFQIYPFSYYYAKTTAAETTLMRVPCRAEFDSVIVFQGCRCEVPASQLNLISSFCSRTTGKTLEFRNECRFSHGQFNGTPEAKMYVARNTSLADLYEPMG